MVIYALKQTNSRSLGAALEYMGKMSYQDPMREQMAAAVARPTNQAIKSAGQSFLQFIYPQT